MGQSRINLLFCQQLFRTEQPINQVSSYYQSPTSPKPAPLRISVFLVINKSHENIKASYMFGRLTLISVALSLKPNGSY